MEETMADEETRRICAYQIRESQGRPEGRNWRKSAASRTVIAIDFEKEARLGVVPTARYPMLAKQKIDSH